MIKDGKKLESKKKKSGRSLNERIKERTRNKNEWFE